MLWAPGWIILRKKITQGEVDRSPSLVISLGQGLFLRLANKPPDSLIFPDTEKEESKQVFPKMPLLLSGQRRRECHLCTRRTPTHVSEPLPLPASSPLGVTIAVVTPEGGKQRKDPAWQRESKTSWIFNRFGIQIFNGLENFPSLQRRVYEGGVRLCIRRTEKGGL